MPAGFPAAAAAAAAAGKGGRLACVIFYRTRLTHTLPSSFCFPSGCHGPSRLPCLQPTPDGWRFDLLLGDELALTIAPGPSLSSLWDSLGLHRRHRLHL
jgi:hypothetical protein